MSGHNQTLDQAIRAAMRAEVLDSAVLAQVSITVFLLSCPDPEAEYRIRCVRVGSAGLSICRSC